MRCKACDVLLDDYEVKRKSTITGEYFDLCSRCLSYIFHDINDRDTDKELDPDIDLDVEMPYLFEKETLVDR